MGLRWSSASKITGMRCLQIVEPAELAAHAWTDNYLCQTPWSPWELAWSYAGPLDGFLCERWNETADAHTWGDNFLCVRPAKIVVAAANTRTFELRNGTETWDIPAIARYLSAGSCTATLVGSRQAVTAAHCVDYQSKTVSGNYGTLELTGTDGKKACTRQVIQVRAYGTTGGRAVLLTLR